MGNIDNSLIKTIREFKEQYAKIEVTPYSEGYSNGFHKAIDMVCLLLSSLKDIEEGKVYSVEQAKEKVFKD